MVFKDLDVLPTSVRCFQYKYSLNACCHTSLMYAGVFPHKMNWKANCGHFPHVRGDVSIAIGTGSPIKYEGAQEAKRQRSVTYDDSKN
jgi:hypothetical protein